MQIVNVCIDLLAVSPLPSIPSFIPFLSWCYHPPSVISWSLPALASLLPLIFTPLLLRHILLSEWSTQQSACVCVSVGAILYLCKQRCLSGHWSEVSQYYRLLLRDREMTNSESEWVRVCFNAFFMSVYWHAWFSGCRACLRFCCLCLSLRPIYCLRATTVVKSSRKTFGV